MKYSLIFIYLLSVPIEGYTQRALPTTPYNWSISDNSRTPPSAFDLHPLNTADLIAEEDGSMLGIKYGVQRTLSANIIVDGTEEELANGEKIFRVILRSPGASMLSVQFDQWELPVGALVHLYNEERTYFIGGFDQRNAINGTMATAVVPGDAVVIEYFVPLDVEPGLLHVSSITHGYRDLFHFREQGLLRDYYPGYSSQPCNINVACTEGTDWQAQKRSAVMFLRPDGNGCSGNMINSVHAPGRPLFHFANHCYQPTTDQFVFYFNYEAPNCTGDTGQTLQTITGATLLANEYYDDFALVRLSSAPQDAGYSVYYAGWDHSGAVPTTGTVIHHPALDVKKITLDQDPLVSITGGETQFWRALWDQGVVEGGSSGAGLFDQNKRLVGHMYGGAQNCANATTIPTDLAKFSESWNGATPTSRLRDWLDSANTGVTALNGFTPDFSSPQVKLNLRAFLEGPIDQTTGLMSATLSASGFLPLEEPYSAIGYTHVGGGGEVTTQAVLNVTNSDAIVDWVVVELRSASNNTQVVASKSGLLQRDGDIVSTDGTSAVSFNMPAGNYYIAVRHRNHLGILTAGVYFLTITPLNLDLSNGTLPLLGGGDAVKIVGTHLAMYSGDVNSDNRLVYTNSNNDRDSILVRIGGLIPTAIVSGYYMEDVNLDGLVIYTGMENDRDKILVNIGGTVPTNVKYGTIP